MTRSRAKGELLPSPAQIAESQAKHADLDRLMQQKVAEILAERESLIFEPFFRSRQVAYELRRLQSVPEQQKWSAYFERYGCLVCETMGRIHAGNGMCGACHAVIFSRLKTIIKGLAEGEWAASGRPAGYRRVKP